MLAVVLVYALARMFWRGVTLFNLVFAFTVPVHAGCTGFALLVAGLSFLNIAA